MTEILDLTFRADGKAASDFKESSYNINVPGYEIVGVCGSGGTAEVYVAIQRSLSRQVALKVMHPHLVHDEERVANFFQEGRINANLSHSNIIPIHDVGTVDEYHYIAMEYMPWGNLRRHMKGSFDLEWTFNVIKQVASALAYSHEHGFIHRDIKPENILFRDENSVVLSDYGIADELEHRKEVMNKSSQGTPRYMSPDILRKKPIGPSSDIYSLGVVFYEMLTGEPPYDCGTPPYTRKDIITVLFAHLRNPIPELPYELRKIQPIINKMLAKYPKDRFYKANDVLEELVLFSQENKFY